MTHNAKVGGILSIISGAFGVLYLLWMVFGILMFRAMFSDPHFMDGSGSLPPSEFFTFMTIFYSAIGLFFTLVGVLAIVGGAFALKRKHWGLALAGAIAGTVVFFPCGIPAIIYAAMSKPEFAKTAPPAAPATPGQ
jgi:hypothetical protein